MAEENVLPAEAVEHEFDEEFLQARVEEITAVGLSKDPQRDLARVLELLRLGAEGGEFDPRPPGTSLENCDVQVYADAQTKLYESLVFGDNWIPLLGEIETYVND